MLKIGLTGGIGSGKSYVCKVFSTLGIAIYPSDQKAKTLLRSNSDLRNEILTEFGPEAYTDKGYNPAFIAGLVFQNIELLQRLNQIVHPYVAIDFVNWCHKYEHTAYIIQEAAILYESGAARLMDYCIVVEAPEEIRIKRVIERDHCDRAQVVNRIQNQWSADKLRSLADWIIQNDDKNLILPQIIKLHEQLITLSNSHG
jgi:dephospho-CoA kinase